MADDIGLGFSVEDVRTMVRIANAISAGRELRAPTQIQLRSLANTVRCLHQLLGLCADGDAATLAAVRAIVALDARR